MSKTASIAILVGTKGSSAKGGGLGPSVVPVVVFTLQEKRVTGKFDLIYYEFIDDTKKMEPSRFVALAVVR